MAIPPQPRPTYQNVTNPNVTNLNVTNPNVINTVNDPLYIASSDHPGMVLTNTPFNGSNFHGWSRNVKMALGAKLKLGFIDGSCSKHGVDDVDAFLYAQSPHELWQEIRERYGRSNGPLIYQLERELSQVTQGNLTIAAFFNKLKKCWDELQNLNGFPTCNCGKMRECTCGVIEKFIERDSNSKLIQFLMKLSDGYESVRSQILDVDPLPSVNKAYYIVQQIEKQKQVTNHVFEPTAFFANMNNKGGNSSRRDVKTGRNDSRHEVKRLCTHCNQEGHTVDQCFEKIRYPDWYKGKKANKSTRIATHVNSRFDEHFHGDTPLDQKLVAAMCQEMMKIYTCDPGCEQLIRGHVLPKLQGDGNGDGDGDRYGYTNFKGIPQSHIAFLANAFATSDPTTFHQASSDSGCIEAMNKELAALESNNTWTLTSLPFGYTPISSKWVYKTKYHPDGSEEREKARLVIYILPPQGYNKAAKGQVFKLNKSLYGLKQASRQWNHELTKFLSSLGYEQSKHDYSLFVKNNKASFTTTLVYVDDVLITGNSEEEIINLKQALDKKFTIKDLGLAKYFLGIELCCTPNGTHLNQRKYIVDLLSDVGLTAAKPTKFPLPTKLKISSDKGTPLKDPSSYRRLVGRLLYLTMTRSDISYAVQHLSQFVSAPKDPYMQAAMHLLRYLKGTVSKGPFYPVQPHLQITGFTDADWASCIMTRKSLIEAEYRAMAATTVELLWLSYLLQDLKIKVKLPVTLFCDNKATQQITATLVSMTEPSIWKLIVISLEISSDHPGMVLTNTPFNSSNFHGWSRNVKIALGAKLKLGFIDGSCFKPGVDDVDNLNGFPTCNCGKMRECTCGVIEKFIERDSNSKLIQFLIKLSDGYEFVRSGNSSRRDVKTGRNDSRHEVKRLCTHCNQEGHTVDQCFEKIRFDEHFHGDTPLDMGSENEVRFGKNDRVDQKLVAAVCQEMMKMFKWKGIMEDKNYAGTSHAGASDHMSPNLKLFISTKTLNQPIIVVLLDESFKTVTIVGEFSPTVCFNKDAYSNSVYKQSVDVHVFHARLGHTSVSKLIHILVCNSIDLSKFSCECCMLSKLHRLPFQLSNSMSERAFELLHMDLWGPYKQPALNGAHYFFTIVNDHTRATWTYLVHTKNQIPVVITSFLTYVETYFQTKPKFIRFDNGTEIVNSECAALFQQKRILHHRSMAYTPQQNRVVERKHMHLLDTARSIRLHASLPIKFWGDSVTKPNKDKFDNRGVKCVLLGYPQNQKGYKLYDLNTKEIFLSRDVVFDETVFPFKGDTFTHPNITPSMHTFSDIFLDEENGVVPNTPLFQSATTQEPIIQTSPAPNTLEPIPHNPPDLNIPTQLPNIANPVSNNERIQTKRSSRQSTKPRWLKDFVTPQSHRANAVSSVSYPLFSSTNFKGIPQSHIAFLANAFAISDPTTFHQASSDSAKQWSLHQLDVNNAFLHGYIDEEIYMLPPQGYNKAAKGQVCKLNRSLYGLKQASRQWNHELTKFLTSLGYEQSKHDYSLFVKNNKASFTTTLVYVDDVLITGNSEEEIINLKQALDKKFTIKDLGLAKYFLGTELCGTPTGTHLNQRKHIVDLLSDVGLTAAKPAEFPLPTELKLSLDKGTPLKDPSSYRRLAAMHLLIYLKGTVLKGLFYPVQPHLQITGFTDADWASCLMTRKSLTEAEYKAMAATTCELLWLSYLRQDLKTKVKLPVTLIKLPNK
ncbi:retrovirus-related pol polyprotein from transposon TNT 1-94 [Tanacetum coccineum]